MVEIVNRMTASANTVGRMSGLGLAFAYLTFLSVCSVLLVVVFLTAYQFQHAIKTAELDGKPVALWKIVELRDNWRIAQARLNKLTGLLEDAQAEVDNQRRWKNTVDAKSDQAFGAASRAENDVVNEFIAAGLPPDIVKAIRDAPIYQHPGLYRAQFAKLVNVDDGRKQGIGAQLTELETLTAKAQEFSNESSSAYSEADLLEKKAAGLQTEVKTAKQDFQTLLAQPGIAVNDQQLLGNFLSQLNALDSSWLAALGSFATMEPDLLTLLLVLAMGTLGGTIHLARLYIDGSAETVGYFLYRPFLGAITALVIFVVARTGIFVIAEPANHNNGAPLSPFFISFVAIISGLLAEQALESVQGVGAKWFSQPIQDTTERFALRVAEYATKLKKTRADLSRVTDLEETEIAALFDGKTKVSAVVQRVAAAWLGQPMRELFTDIPPSDTATK